MTRPFKHDDASMTITIRARKKGNDPIISIGAAGKRGDGSQATVIEDATLPDPSHPEYPGELLDISNEVTKEDVGKRAIVVTNPCIWINIGGTLYKICY